MYARTLYHQMRKNKENNLKQGRNLELRIQNSEFRIEKVDSVPCNKNAVCGKKIR